MAAALQEEAEETSDSNATLFVKNLNFCSTEDDLHELFSTVGPVRSVHHTELASPLYLGMFIPTLPSLLTTDSHTLHTQTGVSRLPQRRTHVTPTTCCQWALVSSSTNTKSMRKRPSRHCRTTIYTTTPCRSRPQQKLQTRPALNDRWHSLHLHYLP